MKKKTHSHLLDLLELVHAEDAACVASVRADLLAEALGDAAVSDWQLRRVHPLVPAAALARCACTCEFGVYACVREKKKKECDDDDNNYDDDDNEIKWGKETRSSQKLNKV